MRQVKIDPTSYDTDNVIMIYTDNVYLWVFSAEKSCICYWKWYSLASGNDY